ncbi:MAG: ABC transporter ATP-binding protein [Chloroflexota bacterium]
MALLSVEHLSKNFDGLSAVRDVSFSVEDGERLAIIGPNGAGKTTLFSLINGQLHPTAGRIYFAGEDITGVPTHRLAHRGQTRSFQLINLFLNLTVLENALLAVHGTERYRFQILRPITGYADLLTKAREVLERAGLWEQRDELVKNVSHGEQRKLDIALTTAASRPKLLLLDEPTAGLTVAEHTDVINMCSTLGRHITLLLVSHDLDVVFGIAERIIVLNLGQVIADGEPKEIQADPHVKEIYLGIDKGPGNAAAS